MVSNYDVLKLIEEEDVIEVLRGLVRSPSQNPPGNEVVASEYISEMMEAWGFESQYVYKPELERPSVAIVCEGTGGSLGLF